MRVFAKGLGCLHLLAHAAGYGHVCGAATSWRTLFACFEPFTSETWIQKSAIADPQKLLFLCYVWTRVSGPRLTPVFLVLSDTWEEQWLNKRGGITILTSISSTKKTVNVINLKYNRIHEMEKACL